MWCEGLFVCKSPFLADLVADRKSVIMKTGISSMKKWLLLAVVLSGYLAAGAQEHRIVVAKDGSGNYATVQEAVDAAPDFSHDTTVVLIKNGVYKERITIPASKRLLKFVGESADSVILTFDNYASKKNIFGANMGTSGSASFYLFASGFTAENITFQNTAGPVGQALAIFIAGDKAKFAHCRFLGFQDTIYTYGNGNSGSGKSSEYFKDCYIEGGTDFIFGAATAVFDHCTIFAARAVIILPRLLPGRGLTSVTFFFIATSPGMLRTTPFTWVAPGGLMRRLYL